MSHIVNNTPLIWNQKTMSLPDIVINIAEDNPSENVDNYIENYVRKYPYPDIPTHMVSIREPFFSSLWQIKHTSLAVDITLGVKQGDFIFIQRNIPLTDTCEDLHCLLVSVRDIPLSSGNEVEQGRKIVTIHRESLRLVLKGARCNVN